MAETVTITTSHRVTLKPLVSAALEREKKLLAWASHAPARAWLPLKPHTG